VRLERHRAGIVLDLDPMAPVDLPIREGLQGLPRWARVAFAARCARRVEPLFRQAWPDAPVELVEAVQRAVECAETSASVASIRYVAPERALAADEAAHRASFAPKPVASGGAYDCAHAAANAAGTVAYPAEAAMGAYYAALDAAQALESILGEDSRSILDDLEALVRAAREGKWTDETAVPPDFFAPLPGAPLDEHERARIAAYHDWERAGRPQLSKEEQERMYFVALGRIRRKQR
jgi:hypothetical protein